MRRDDDRNRESVSGAMQGSGEGAGSGDLPYPRTDAEDSGTGDGGLDGARRADDGGDRAGPGRNAVDGHTPSPEGDVTRSGDWERIRPDGYDEGIGGGPAGGTGL